MNMNFHSKYNVPWSTLVCAGPTHTELCYIVYTLNWMYLNSKNEFENHIKKEINCDLVHDED